MRKPISAVWCPFAKVAGVWVSIPRRYVPKPCIALYLVVASQIRSSPSFVTNNTFVSGQELNSKMDFFFTGICVTKYGY
jgi:hypothetical protein